MSEALPVSIVIPVRNEAANLAEMFSDLLSLSPPPSEIVFVETGSVDGSQQRIDSWLAVAEQEGISCCLVYAPDAFPGAARNAGVRAAKHPWIAFLDAGISPRTDWLGQLWQARGEGEFLGVYGVCRFRTEHPFGRMIAALSYGQENVAPVLPASLFHRQVFEQAGYFQEGLRSGEDILWNRSIASVGLPTTTCVDAEVEYRHFPETLWLALKKWFVYEQSAAVAGLGGGRKNAVLALVACIYGLLALNVSGSGFALMGYLALRGGLDPIRRSRNWRWWNRWWQPFVIFPVAGMLDFATMAGRLTAWMGFSKFHLHVSNT